MRLSDASGAQLFTAPAVRPADHVALERVVDRRRRQRVDEAGGHQQLPRRIVGRQEVAQRHGQRDVACRWTAAGRRRGTRSRPAAAHRCPPPPATAPSAAGRPGGTAAAATRRRCAPPRRARSGSLSDACFSTQIAVGRGDRHHRQDQRPLVVEQAVDAHRLVHRHRQERGRDEVGEQRQVHHRAAAAHLEPADRERGAGGDEQREHARPPRR